MCRSVAAMELANKLCLQLASFHGKRNGAELLHTALQYMSVATEQQQAPDCLLLSKMF